MGSVICKVSATQLGDKTVGRIVGLKTLGDEELVKRQFEGLVKCMRDGTEADGMARQIGGWVTVYPVFVGPIDLSKGFDPEKNGVRIRMRLLNEIDVDITDWEFRDVTPGRTPFTLDSASTGELVNTVKVGDPIHVNGRPFPSHDALRVDWAVEGTDRSGTIPAEKFTSDATLITIAADALAEIASEEYDGKTIVFTVRGNFSSAKIAATLRAETPAPVPKAQTSDGVAKVWGVRDGESETELHADNDWTLVGTDLNRAAPEWRIDAAMAEVNGESCGLTFNGGPDSVVLDPSEIAALPAGEYEGGRLKLYMVKGPVDETVSETLDAPLGRIIVG